jgi:hypothetical protein
MPRVAAHQVFNAPTIAALVCTVGASPSSCDKGGVLIDLATTPACHACDIASRSALRMRSA